MCFFNTFTAMYTLHQNEWYLTTYVTIIVWMWMCSHEKKMLLINVLMCGLYEPLKQEERKVLLLNIF